MFGVDLGAPNFMLVDYDHLSSIKPALASMTLKGRQQLAEAVGDAFRCAFRAELMSTRSVSRPMLSWEHNGINDRLAMTMIDIRKALHQSSGFKSRTTPKF